MLFNSLDFLIFFPTVTILYFILPHSYRWILLLIASCIFYMFFIPIYILILFFLIIIDYAAGIFIEKAEGERKRIFLIISILSNCGVLFVFKYFNFFNNTFSGLFHFFNLNYTVSNLSIILPIGLSFHTFQSMSYIIEVYRGNQKAEYNFGIYALYVMFYPQLVAGPIERPGHLLHQLTERHTFDYERVSRGLQLMLWGLFKKVVIADRLAAMVDIVYRDPTQFQGVPLIVATVFFAYQIYCDFSGYSDIAIGAAQVMGFKLMANFNRPYFSKSISEFWKRWHISLSTWFKDYLYISMGGNRVKKERWYFNLFITFLVSGLWHGANWTFVIWGALNGFYLIFSIWTSDIRSKFTESFGIDQFPKINKLLKIATTFGLTCFAWIFFRAKNFDHASYIVTHLFTGITVFFDHIHDAGFVARNLFLKSPAEFLIAILSVAFMESLHLMQRHGSIRDSIARKPVWARFTIYVCVILSILIFGKFGKESQQFIYFQF